MILKRLFTPVSSIDPQTAKDIMNKHKEGTITVLDVRQAGEYEEGHIPGAKLIPLPQLHDSTSELDPEQPVITYCAVGGRSRVAAQLLSGMGFTEVYNLKGGIRAWDGQKAVGPKELSLDMLRGDETPEEIVSTAYGMESGLQTFYKQMFNRTEDVELKELFIRLAEVEENHRRMLQELDAKFVPPAEEPPASDATTKPLILEGGFNIEDFIAQNELFLSAVPDVVDLAMMLETQALDLYLRFAYKSSHPETKRVLFRIADEEKVHLARLGNLLEEKI